MSNILVIGEDALCCALGAKLVSEVLPGWSMPSAPVNKRGITKLLPDLVRYASHAAHVKPVICIADTDRRCAVDLVREHRPVNAPERFLLRFAVSEAESWVLADRDAVSEFFGVRVGRIPANPDELLDAKQAVLRLAQSARARHLRAEMVSSNEVRPGAGYNTHICSLVERDWSVARAVQSSPSLKRAVDRLVALAQG